MHGHMKSMKLYDQVERIHNELRAIGIADSAPLKVENLTPFDQYHYHGLEAVDTAIEMLSLTPESRLLEVGSGIGGPARYIASRTACRVTALELQPDLHALAEELTRRCALEEAVRHLCGDILERPLAEEAFDGLIALLVFLHIEDRAALFAACRQCLKSGAAMFVEDFTKLKEPSAAQWGDLRQKVMCPYVPTEDAYLAQLNEAGFSLRLVEDMTDSWTAFTSERLAAFRAARDRNLAVHGAAITEGLEDFYATVASLYADGVIGGIRILAVAD